MHAHRFKSLGGIVALAAALSAQEGVASSQPTPTGEEAVKLADAYFLKGKALLKEGNIKGAYKEYKASWDLKRTYDIAANLGNVEFELGMPRDAAEHLAFSLRNAAVSVAPERLEKIRKLLEQAKVLVASAVVRVNVDGAEILIDGQSMGRSPLMEELYVDPGTRTFEARLAGHETATQKLSFERAGYHSITLTLTPLAAAPLGSGKSPKPVSSAPVVVPHKGIIPLGVGIGVTAAGVGLGLVSLLVSVSKSSEADRLRDGLLAESHQSLSACTPESPPADCARLDSAYVAAGSFRNLAIVGFATAGVATLTTLTYALIPPAPVPATDGRVRASINVGPGGGGLILGGRF